jgi:GNAT superfamily N-acetyltransferase
MNKPQDDYQAREVLKDAREVIITAVRPESRLDMPEGRFSYSAQSAFSRFFSQMDRASHHNLPAIGKLQFNCHAALVAHIAASEGDIPAGVARYIVQLNDEQAGTRAEVAFTVIEEFQGIGIGTVLLKHLSIVARSAGVTHFLGYVLPENIKMIKVFESCMLPLERSLTDSGVLELTIELARPTKQPSFKP